MRRRARLFAAAPLVAAAALVTAAGCAPYHAGAAATVGSDRISTSQLRGLTTQVLAAQPATGTSNVAQTQVQQRTLGELIALRVLARMASQSGTTVTTAEIGTARSSLIAQIEAGQSSGTTPPSPSAQAAAASAAAAAAGVPLDQLATLTATVQAVSGALPVSDSQLQAAYAQEGDHRTYRVDEIDTGSQAGATAAATVLRRSAAQLPAVAAALGVPTPTPLTVGASQLEQQTGSTGPLKAGTVLGPLSLQGGGYAVVLIAATGTRTLADAQAPGSPERISVERSAFAAAYAAAAKSLGVHVSPRFGGSWSVTGADLTGLGIGAVGTGGGSLSSPVAGSSGAAPAGAGGG